MFQRLRHFIRNRFIHTLRIVEQIADRLQTIMQIVQPFHQRSIATTSTRFRIIRQNFNLLLHRLQLVLELVVIDDSRFRLNFLQRLFDVAQLLTMRVGRFLHQIVAMRTVQASLMTIVFVFLAPVTPASFNVIVARTLAVLVALESLRTAAVTIAWFATRRREAVLVRFALVTVESVGSKKEKLDSFASMCVQPHTYPVTPGLQ